MCRSIKRHLTCGFLAKTNTSTPSSSPSANPLEGFHRSQKVIAMFATPEPKKAKAVPNEHFDTDMAPLLKEAIDHARATRPRPSGVHAARREAVIAAREKRHLRLVHSET